MIIGGRDLTQQRLLIAEIGNNHDGDATKALEMVVAAAEAGADAVKVQVIEPTRLVNRLQTERIAQLARFKLSFETFAEMASLAHSKGILFIASVFDINALEQFAPLLDAIKIASGDLDFTLSLIKTASLDKPIILSTGMNTLDEVNIAIKTIGDNLSSGSLLERLALLHCVSLYPVSFADANLRVIQTLRETFNLIVGYSDHTLGVEGAMVSLALGARIIEKHFTLDKTRTTFRDHALSADPTDLKRLAEIVHAADLMLGSGEKNLCAAEVEMAKAARRSIVASRDLPQGTSLTLNDFDYVRPRNGFPPQKAKEFVGRVTRKLLQAHEVMTEDYLG